MMVDNAHGSAGVSGALGRPPVDVARFDRPLGREFVLDLQPDWLESGFSGLPQTIARLLMQHGVLRRADPGPYVLTTRGEPGVWAHGELPNTLANLLPDLAFHLGIADYLNAVREIPYGIAGLARTPGGGLLNVEMGLGLLELVDSGSSFPYPYEYEDDVGCDDGSEECQPYDVETAVPVVNHAQCRARGSTLPLRLHGEINHTDGALAHDAYDHRCMATAGAGTLVGASARLRGPVARVRLPAPGRDWVGMYRRATCCRPHG
jgi:hypothetical protein